MLLAFDTATPAVTVALHDGDRVRAEQTVVDARRHGELLAPGIARVLRDARVSADEVSKIAVGVGPGPFTGLRVGLVTARAMGDALGIPVVGVCTLDVPPAHAAQRGGGRRSNADRAHAGVTALRAPGSTASGRRRYNGCGSSSVTRAAATSSQRVAAAGNLGS